MSDFTMPSLGADMEDATLVSWKVKPGDTVRRGDIIAEVETDKGLIEIEVFETGIIESLTASEGDTLPVGAVLAHIRESSPPTTTTDHPSTAPPVQRVRISPLARKVATSLGIDVSGLHGTGPGGAIERADVERVAAAAAAPAAAAAAAVPLTTQPTPLITTAPTTPAIGSPALLKMRRAVAAAMSRSHHEIPPYHLSTRINMSRSMEWLAMANTQRPLKERLIPLALLLHAVARTLKDHADLNGVWQDHQLIRKEDVHINVAIATRHGGLITPALHHVDQKSVGDIMVALQELIPRARDGGLRSSELSEGTITVTSLGDLGVETVFGVIYPPQVAILGFGRITEQPWAENGLLGVRPVLQATLTGDHRATDGRTGARFLEALNRQFQHPPPP